MLDAQSGKSRSLPVKPYKRANDEYYSGSWPDAYGGGFTDSGGASRFFYVAKTSRHERNYGTDKNSHPTVKPFTLMRYLCNLITPPGGVVLDPFLGSGTTGAVAVACGYRFIGIERESEYFEIAKARIGDVKWKREPAEEVDADFY
jgi:DNA modification methylase